MIYIENEGALFRGPARGVPLEVWSPRKDMFVPYEGSKDKPVEWGHEISEAEAQEMMEQSRMEYQQEVFGDVPADRAPLSDEYRDSVLPEHVKQRLKKP